MFYDLDTCTSIVDAMPRKAREEMGQT